MMGVLVSAILLGVAALPSLLYEKKGLFKHFFHDVLEWHVADDGPRWTDGENEWCCCKYCGETVTRYL